MHKKANAAAIFKVHHDDFLAQILSLDAYRVCFIFNFFLTKTVLKSPQVFVTIIQFSDKIM